MIGGGEIGLLDAWTAAARGTRQDQIVHLSRHVLGHEAGARPWDEASAALLELAAAGGDRPLDALVTCPTCGAPAEIRVPVHELLAAARAASPHPAASGGASLAVPTVADVVEAAALDPATAGARLAAATGISQLDEVERARAAAALDQAHPILAPTIGFSCPSCQERAEVALDVVGLAWSAVAERARSCMDDVVALARAFGWSEEEVAAVPAPRRALYRRLLEEPAHRD